MHVGLSLVDLPNPVTCIVSTLPSALHDATGLWTYSYVRLLVCCSYGVFLTLATTLAITLCEVSGMNHEALCSGARHMPTEHLASGCLSIRITSTMVLSAYTVCAKCAAGLPRHHALLLLPHLGHLPR
jgi:hypothetical protein